MKLEELKKLLLEDGNEQEYIDEYITHCQKYNLMCEVLDFTKAYISKGDRPTTAFINAMLEWDL